MTGVVVLKGVNAGALFCVTRPKLDKTIGLPILSTVRELMTKSRGNIVPCCGVGL